MSDRPAQLRPRTILVVDDETQVRDVTVLMLQSAGFTALSASTPREGLELAAAYPGPIDLLLSDFGLPGMNGVELARKLGETRPEMRLLLFSGDVREQLVRDGSIGADTPFLGKPFLFSDLLEKVRGILA
jgi:two-component system, cell cycle sensor histidine kinase and response regulator CckA